MSAALFNAISKLEERVDELTRELERAKVRIARSEAEIERLRTAKRPDRVPIKAPPKPKILRDLEKSLGKV